MCVKFTDAEIAYIKESVENYSSEFDIYDDEQELKLKIYEQIMLKIVRIQGYLFIPSY